ncbi:hypothetical protein PN471_20815 [Aphanizomenon sp. CS-733/32]|uniref:hypothetical protein n=1 Tax=Aphanizomenon sp. CS-733/32 TaxID=3021715 RepID=UPI00232EF54E|nr:hypothetical protein [Aphanizomenon sp. CS-733/32]MDB9311023.1 hypothetical protein [Aphanizomenon sp. CS-733/32]
MMICYNAYLGLTPGKAGSDGGIDGYAKMIHEANIGIMLASASYTDGFRFRLNKSIQSNNTLSKYK